MAIENIAIDDNAGDPQLVAVDDVGGAKYQVVKIALGDDGQHDALLGAAGHAVPVSDEEAAFLLRRLLMYLDSPAGYDKSTQRQRVTALLESGTVTTVTTCSTVTNLSTIDTMQGRLAVSALDAMAYQRGMLDRIY